MFRVPEGTLRRPSDAVRSLSNRTDFDICRAVDRGFVGHLPRCSFSIVSGFWDARLALVLCNLFVHSCYPLLVVQFFIPTCLSSQDCAQAFLGTWAFIFPFARGPTKSDMQEHADTSACFLSRCVPAVPHECVPIAPEHSRLARATRGLFCSFLLSDKGC